MKVESLKRILDELPDYYEVKVEVESASGTTHRRHAIEVSVEQRCGIQSEETTPVVVIR